MSYVIGLDFDNTLVNYDDVFCKVAIERHLIEPTVGVTKRDLRDYIRRLPDGERHWREVQAIVYGSRMDEAKIIDGVVTFLRLCRQANVKVYVISHKTEFAYTGQTEINLRAAALDWMVKNNFFETYGLALDRAAVFFEPTRSDKVQRIKTCGCTHFIDDLEETFQEQSFPEGVEKILYTPGRKTQAALNGVKVVTVWRQIADYFFDADKLRQSGNN